MKVPSFRFVRFVLCGAGAAFLAVAAGCSSETTTQYGNTDAFCAAKAKEECQKAPSLCAVSQSACENARKATCLTFASQQGTGGRTYRSDNVQACLDKTHAAYGNDPVKASDLDDMQTTCAKVFQGSTKEFSACQSDYECENDLICDKQLCAHKVVKSSGQPCGNPGEVCDDSSYCTTNSGNVFVCTPKKTQGLTCDDKTSPCATDLRCATVCQPKVGAGGQCTTNDDCTSDAPFCDPYQGSKCDGGIRFGAGTSCKDYGGS